jgi:hypothetical protein
MSTQTFYRKADVPQAQAVSALLAAHPNSKIIRVDTKKASPSEARFANARPGQRIFEAVIRTAEEGEEGLLDLSKGSEGSEESKAPDFGGESKAEDEGGESESEEKSEDKEESKGEEEGGDDLGLGDLGEPEELSDVDKLVGVLQQIADALGGGLGPKGPGPGDLGDDLGAPDDSMVLPDIGAPAAGGKPPMGGGPGGPGGALPPPVAPKKSPASFASFTAVRRDVDKRVTTTELIAEAETNWPTHKVAQVKRNGIAAIKGVQVDLPAHEIALVTLVKK